MTTPSPLPLDTVASRCATYGTLPMGNVPPNHTRMRLAVLSGMVVCLLLPGTQWADETSPVESSSKAAGRVDFRRDVFPLLEARCFRCHEGRDASSGVRLDVRSALLYADDGSPPVVAGRGAESRLIHLVSGRDAELRMPPEGPPLDTGQVALLRTWIDQGVAWDDRLLPPEMDARRHWAFQRIVPPSPPESAGPQWSINPIDRFVAARQHEQRLQSSEEAPRGVLIRRLSLDLLGLPPTGEDVDRFVADPAPDAYERLVDRLLASPGYGERWGRHWLDVARWAESEGYESNHDRPYAWRYRDYVIRSFNQNKPYDRFVTEQLAGDELQPYRDEQLIATGFLAAARLSSNEEDKCLQRNDLLVDIVNATSSALLGLTMGCAQCHDHKFDPLTARDYYRLQGFFLSGQPVNVALGGEVLRQQQVLPPAEYEPAVALREALFEAARGVRNAEVRRQLTPEEREAVDTPLDQRSREQERLARQADLKFQSTPAGVEKYLPESDRKLYDELRRKIEAIEKNTPFTAQTLAFYSPVTSPHGLKVLSMQGFYPLPFDPDELARRRPYLQIRGDVHNLGPTLQTGWPAIFDEVMESPPSESPTNGRSDLARWLTDPRHPLTARVWVNRLWQYHFGQGIVATAGDFGFRGQRPSHPRLLDWLAAELLESGWDTKHLQRLIVTSATYRQSSQASNPDVLQRDQDNRWLTRWKPRRLEAEALRDTMLAVTGRLEMTLGGPSVPASQYATTGRRSLYLFQKRGLPPAMQALLDGPNEVSESCLQRQVSTTALQSLYLLNSDEILALARQLAEVIVAETRTADSATADSATADSATARRRQVERAFSRVLGRLPDATEWQAAERFFAEFAEFQLAAATNPAGGEPRPAEAREEPGVEPPANLVHFCQALLNLNEFTYIE